VPPTRFALRPLLRVGLEFACPRSARRGCAQPVGRHMYAAARQRGHTIRLIRRKNPAKSQIVYQDAYQVAILPASRQR